MRSLHFALVGLVGALLFLTAPAAAEVAYSRAPEAVVVEFHETVGELRGPQARVSLRIHGDGRFVVQRPPGMRPSGEFEGRLKAAELRRLMGSFADDGVLGFDAAAAQSARSAARVGTVFEASDPSTIELVVRAARTAPGAKAPAMPAEQRIRWVGLRGDAHAHPEIEALQGLARSCAVLRALVDAPAPELLP